MNKERLLNVAKALRESLKPEDFSMDMYHVCGTPACALGHYAARPDLQSAFALGKDGRSGLFRASDEAQSWDQCIAYCGPAICEHFDISADQATDLFADGDTDEDDEVITEVGCGNPKNAIEAAEYIERFVADCA